MARVLIFFLLNQMFHGVDACSAFSFVLSGETNRVYSGFRTIAEEMQVSFTCYFLMECCPHPAIQNPCIYQSDHFSDINPSFA